MVVDGKYAKMWISDGILYFVYKPVYEIDLNRAKVVVKQRLELQNEIAYPIFCDFREVHNAHKEARDYLALEGSLMTKALALLVKDHHSFVILRMYLKTAIAEYPFKVFTDKAEALSYLQAFK